MTEQPAAICPCEAVAHPRVIDNPPGLTTVRYRAGDYGAFRDALLRGLPDERELLRWRPTATGDLALQLLEWWAYIADILTFYNEQIANGAYLGTAVLPGAVAQLVRLLGYRPRPGIGATAVLAALVNGTQPVTLPVGFAVQSKPGPGEQPKIFEISGATARALPNAAGGVVPVDAIQVTSIHGRTSLLLRGTITSVKPGDVVVVAGAPATAANSQAMTIASSRGETDPRGRALTRLLFTAALAVPDGDVTAYRVLRSEVFQTPFPYAAASAVFSATVDHPVPVLHVASIAGPARSGSSSHASPGGLAVALAPTIHLAQVARSIGAGDLVLCEASSGSAPSYTPAVVTAASEAIWYANAASPSAPDVPPAAPTNPFPVPHSVLTLDVSPAHTTTRVWSGFRTVGEIVGEPAGPTIAGPAFHLAPLARLDPQAALGQAIALEDATGAGALGTFATPPTAADVRVATASGAVLAPPLRLLGNLFEVTEGKTVIGEVLGDGDPTVAGQAFALHKSPLTYLAGTDPAFPTSTLAIRVDSLAWTEVASFYGQAADAQVFVTREDADQKTHVRFGDGVNGARLPRGVANVVASYRFGSGGPAPAAGSLVTIVKPVPGLAAVRNPVRATGGDDPTPAATMRRYAPRSVLTFGRAVSAGDYEAIAGRAPAVTRARAYYSWDAPRQRAMVVVYVGDDDGARASAQHAIDSARDPNVAATVALGTPIRLGLGLTVAYAARFAAAVLQPRIVEALIGDAGLFAPSRIRIGEPLYRSEIYAACLGVAGTRAVRGLTITRAPAPAPLPGVRHSPGEGGFFTVAPSDIHLTLEAELDG